MERSVDDRPRSSKDRHHVDNGAQRTLEDTISERGGPTESSTSNAEAGASSETESSNITSEYAVVSHGFRSDEMNKEETRLMKTEDLHHSSRMGVEINHNGYVMDISDSVASTSFREEESSDLVNTRVNKEPNNDIENSVNASASLPCRCLSRRSCSQEFSRASAYELPDETFLGENRVGQDNNSLVDPARVDPVGNASVTSNTELGVSGREQNGRNEHMPAAEPVSDSSNFSSITNNDSSNFESRRNRRRLFFYASSGNSSERLTAYPNRVFSSGNNDNRSSQNTRHVESNGDLSSGARVNNRSQRRQHSRSEIWDVLYGNLIENQQQNNLCPFGVHPDGSCSCDSSLTGEESSIHLSISRIVMLAEALFEVLDEIQPRSASFPLPLASHAAPESVVDSFPLREHSKRKTAESPEEVQQCYICLSEYEDGDKIRILPCHHEYHMACVDKWLKQIQGVCPLCRGDVAQGSNSTD